MTQTREENGGTILFAGGGTGGHLLPAIAVGEQLRARELPLDIHFACSDRQIDRDILCDAGEAFTPLGVQPLPRRPWQIPSFLRGYLQSRKRAERLIEQQDVRAVVALGGFVSGPVVAAARRRGVPTLLVNLDAVPGIANRWVAKRCDRILTVFESPQLPQQAEPIPMPIRGAAIAADDAAECRRQLGLDPDRPTLTITGASQGADSINRTFTELIHHEQVPRALEGWQVLHLAGPGRGKPIEMAYRQCEFPVKVIEFTEQMGVVWGATSLAISRAGAGSVGEIALNAVPAIFLPYPHHKDQHQKHNAQPLADAGGAIIIDDTVNAAANAQRLLDPLTRLLTTPQRLEKMRQALLSLERQNGTEPLARHVAELAGAG